MKELAQYLVEYLEQGIEVHNAYKMHELLKEAFDAYQSTENCTIAICGGECPDCGAFMRKGIDVLYDCDGNNIEFCKYECPECGYIIHG